MREYTVSPLVEFAPDEHLTDPVWRHAASHPEHPAVLRPDPAGGWTPVTCAALHHDVRTLARGLLAAGIQPGDRVGLMSRTRYEWTLVDYAVWACGAVTVPIYETSSAEQVAWILSDSGAVACVVETDAHADLVGHPAAHLPELREVWRIDAGDLAALADRGADVPAEQVEARRAAAGIDDLATIIYTSGTTGRPKGCELTHRNMYADIGNALPLLRGVFDENATTLLFLPLAHAFARLIQIGAIQSRATLGHTADLLNLAQTIREFRPTFLLSVPRVFEKVYNTARQKAAAEGKSTIFARAEKVAVTYSQALDTGGPGLPLRLEHALFDRLVYRKLRAALGGRCTGAMAGGAPLGARLAHFFRGVGITVYEGYGLTETSPAATVSLPGATRIGSVGRALPGVGLRIADDGEILIGGDIVFRGYWNNPAATAEALTGDGWLRTGDLGALDDDGYLRITGRKKEIIVTAGGKNVAPAGLEDQLRAHPLVSQCMVVGDGRPFIAALVTLDETALPAWLAAHGRPADTALAELRDDPTLRTQLQEAVDAVNATVSQAESIRTFRVLPRDFTEATGELTPSLKVKRRVVLEQYADEVERLYRR
ncbi:long-chain-fatty-acid--CoA ligase [Pilimelia terevasa]|uniref:Acyl-CoA synthetase n=1 Tax=Pilimelia terevasa TaxID=53372 RepID=A0A8J3FIT3_9ACTN|nr:AMP-dependent synthetase/ligase [Pilimelia terevasa]GGK26483.1 long-chain-fatty-acid--CoA ligase [Pilimelia terevasa]